MKKEASRKDREDSKGCFTRRRKVAIKAQRFCTQIGKFLQTGLSFRSLNGFRMHTLLAVVCDEGRKEFPRMAREISNRLCAQQQKAGFEIRAGEKS